MNSNNKLPIFPRTKISSIDIALNCDKEIRQLKKQGSKSKAQKQEIARLILILLEIYKTGVPSIFFETI